MERIKLPNTDIEVSRLIAGCMGLGGGWAKERPSDAELLKQADTFISANLDLGIDFFDHADIYAQGRAEEFFGRALAQRPGLRQSIVLQTKCGIRWKDDPPGTPQRFDFSKEWILKAVDASLKRLHTDYVDILLLHRPDILWQGEEIAEAFSALKRTGKVRYFGVSNQNRFQIEYLQHFLDAPLVADQVQMSLLHYQFAEVGISFNQRTNDYPQGWEGLMEYCRLNGVSLQAWSPVDRGVLVSAQRDTLGAEEQHTAQVLASMASEYGVAPEALQLAWLLRHPARIQPVLGTTRPDRLATYATALDVVLSREDWYELFEAARGRSMP